MHAPDYENRLLKELSRHVGRGRAVGMGELYQAVYERPYDHRINDTRQLRKLITKLRREGTPICSASATDGGGYFLASAGSELEDYSRRLRKKALKGLKQEAVLRRVTLPELVGQIVINLEGAG